MRLLRLTLGAALLVGAAPLATASHARCVEEFAIVCSTFTRACRQVADLRVVDPHCPYM